MTNTTLRVHIEEAMKSAMRAKNKQRLAIIRLILAAIKQKEIDERITLSDSQVIDVLEKMLKQRRDSVEQYQKADRQELADQELFEIEVIQEYMPEALSETEIEKLIDAAISTTSALSTKDMGKVMTEIKPHLQGRADMRSVSDKIKKRLTS